MNGDVICSEDTVLEEKDQKKPSLVVDTPPGLDLQEDQEPGLDLQEGQEAGQDEEDRRTLLTLDSSSEGLHCTSTLYLYNSSLS